MRENEHLRPAHRVAVRPQPNVEDALELGQRDEVWPSSACDEILNRATGEASIAAHGRERAATELSADTASDSSRVQRGHGNRVHRRAVGEGATEVVSGHALDRTPPHHAPDRRSTGAPLLVAAPGSTCARFGCKSPDQCEAPMRPIVNAILLHLRLPAQTCKIRESGIEQAFIFEDQPWQPSSSSQRSSR